MKEVSKRKRVKHREGTKIWHSDRIKKLHKKCWDLMSQYVRLRDKGICITCGGRNPIMHGGHFFHGCLDFDERNINCQCSGCNTYKGGMRDVYAVRLEDKYGLGILQELERLKWQKPFYTFEELEEIKTDLEYKLQALKVEELCG